MGLGVRRRQPRGVFCTTPVRSCRLWVGRPRYCPKRPGLTARPAPATADRPGGMIGSRDAYRALGWSWVEEPCLSAVHESFDTLSHTLAYRIDQHPRERERERERSAKPRPIEPCTVHIHTRLSAALRATLSPPATHVTSSCPPAPPACGLINHLSIYRMYLRLPACLRPSVGPMFGQTHCYLSLYREYWDKNGRHPPPRVTWQPCHDAPSERNFGLFSADRIGTL